MGHTWPLFKKKWAKPGLFIVYFWSFQTNIVTNFTTNICEKCPSSLRCWDLNPWPSGHESPPITTRPWLPPYMAPFYQMIMKTYPARIWDSNSRPLNHKSPPVTTTSGSTGGFVPWCNSINLSDITAWH